MASARARTRVGVGGGWASAARVENEEGVESVPVGLGHLEVEAFPEVGVELGNGGFGAAGGHVGKGGLAEGTAEEEAGAVGAKGG